MCDLLVANFEPCIQHIQQKWELFLSTSYKKDVVQDLEEMSQSIFVGTALYTACRYVKKGNVSSKKVALLCEITIAVIIIIIFHYWFNN